MAHSPATPSFPPFPACHVVLWHHLDCSLSCTSNPYANTTSSSHLLSHIVPGILLVTDINISLPGCWGLQIHLPSSTFQPLRLILHSKWIMSSLPLFRTFQWLPTTLRVKSKLGNVAYKTLYDLAPPAPSPSLSVPYCIPATLAFSQLLKQNNLCSASGPLDTLYVISNTRPLPIPIHHLTLIHPSSHCLYLY